MTIDFVQVFGSMSHTFYNPALKKYSFGDNFIDWIKMLLKNQGSFVMKGGHISKYFKLERGAHQVVQYQHIFLFLY